MSRLAFASFEAQSNVNDSRVTPFTDCVVMFEVDEGDTDVSVSGNEVEAATVGGGEMNDPSGLVFGDAEIKPVVVVTMIGAERLVDDAIVVDGAVSSDVGDFVDTEPSTVDVIAGSAVGSGISTLRLRSSEDPPQAAATRRSAASTRDRRFEFTSETLFRFVPYGSSADEISVTNHR